MRRLNSFYICFLLSISFYGQSTIDKSIDVTDLEEVEIILHNTFQIEITNNFENKIVFHSVSEGEYKDDIFIKSHRTKQKVVLKDALQPFSKNYNDKLSAHKVFAVKVKLQIPEHLNVRIISRIASLELNGKFKNLFIELNSGDCLLNNFLGDATVNTLSGNINLFTKNAMVKTISKSGKIRAKRITGKHKINLKTISGDISVHKTK